MLGVFTRLAKGAKTIEEGVLKETGASQVPYTARHALSDGIWPWDAERSGPGLHDAPDLRQPHLLVRTAARYLCICVVQPPRRMTRCVR